MSERARTSTGYQPDFDVDNRRGEVGEALVGTFIEAAAASTIEAKTDYGTATTGNHYVETHQLDASKRWRPSGINVTKAEWWAVAAPDGHGLLLIRTEELKRLALESPRANQPIRGERSNPTRGRLVPIARIVDSILGVWGA